MNTMRTKLMILLAVVGGILLARNLHGILLVLPDEASQGAIWRIFYFHLPAAMIGGFCALLALIGSVGYLVTRNFRMDSLAVAVTEVGLLWGAMVLITGMIWAKIIWGVWWVWDGRLTSMLVTWLMYASYPMLRRAIEDPTERARNAAVLNIFTAPGVYITWKSIEWWRTQHPGPVLELRGGGGMAPGMESMAYWNVLALLLISLVLIMLRLKQEERQRELDALRRTVHAF
jgi:heme exporter protein C